MEILKSAGMILFAAALVAALCAFIYACLFKSNEWNMPNAARGVGLCVLAGVLKVVLSFLSLKVSPWFGVPWLDYPLIALLVVGVLLMMTGLGEGPK